MSERQADMRCELAIFGSGFASYELAHAAIASGRSVVVIEKGTDQPSPTNLDLSSIAYRREPIVSGGVGFGANVPPGFENAPRYVGLGGTSELWSGKWRRLDALDFDRHLNGRRWPILATELMPHIAAIEAENGHPDWSADSSFAELQAHAASRGVRLIGVYEQPVPVRLRPKWLELQRNHGSLQLLCDAQTRGAAFASGGERLTEVRMRCGHDEQTVVADAFVVACGGIESVHVGHQLRMWSNEARRTAGQLDRKYRGFMDHPKAVIGEVTVEHNLPLVEYLQRAQRDRQRVIGLGLPEDELARTGIGNHTVFLGSDESPAMGQLLTMVINLEQFPEAENFVTADPDAIVSWRISSATLSDCQRFLSRLVPRLTALIGSVALQPSLRFRGASHHMGALPMGEAGQGVVDLQCRFHDLLNVYCVSSAVFPIAGSANPTLTLAALSRRLADHLARS